MSWFRNKLHNYNLLRRWLAHTCTKLLVWTSATLVGWHRVRRRYENDWVLTYTRIRSLVRLLNMTKARVSWFVLCSREFIFIYCFLFFPFALLFLSNFLQHLLCRRHLLREENKGIAFQAKNICRHLVVHLARWSPIMVFKMIC